MKTFLSETIALANLIDSKSVTATADGVEEVSEVIEQPYIQGDIAVLVKTNITGDGDKVSISKIEHCDTKDGTFEYVDLIAVKQPEKVVDKDEPIKLLGIKVDQLKRFIKITLKAEGSGTFNVEAILLQSKL